MADDNAVELIKRSDGRFSKRQNLDSLRHEIALNFAPHLAEWTGPLIMGDDFCAHMADGTPLLIARDYIGQIGATLRPPGKQWFWHRTQDDDLNEDPEVRTYLDWRSNQMRRVMFDRITGTEGALSAADEFYGLFGDAVLAFDLTPDRSAIRAQNFHTKDCVWAIGANNTADTITRKEVLPARVIKQRFPLKSDKLHEKVVEACDKSPDTEFELRHEVLPAYEYDSYIKRSPLKKQDGWVSVWIDVANRVVIREAYHPTMRYVVPRAGKRHGWPYGFSRATMAALPDARMLQQQAVAIMEAAEKQLSPPLIAYSDAIRGDIRLDGITWVDRNYDSRSGAPVEPLELGKNFNLGVDAILRTEQQLIRAFMLDRLRMPDTRTSKSTMEVSFLIDEYVRSSLPLFGPMKSEYSDEVLYEVDRLVEIAGGYAARQKPKALQDMEMSFAWDNPLTDMLERQKAQKLSEAATLIQTGAAVEAAAQQVPSVGQMDVGRAVRSSLIGVGVADWLKTEKQVKQDAEARAQAQQMEQAMAQAPNLADVVHRGAQAAQIASDIPNPAEPSMPLLPAPV